jgi:hypothetical protein
MRDLEATGDDTHRVLVEEQGAGDVRRPRRHRVRDLFEHHVGRRTDEDGDAQRELFRNDPDGAQAASSVCSTAVSLCTRRTVSTDASLRRATSAGVKPAASRTWISRRSSKGSTSPSSHPFAPRVGITAAMIGMSSPIILHAPFVGEQPRFRNGVQQFFRNHQLARRLVGSGSLGKDGRP